MRVELENIGSISKTVIELDKNLIVFSGPNNSGKTYASYCLYGLSKFTPKYTEDFLAELIKSSFTDLINIGEEEIDLAELSQYIDDIQAEYSSQFKEYLPILFGMDSDYFLKSSVKINLGTKEEFVQYLKTFKFQLGGTSFGGVSINYRKPSDDTKLLLNFQRNNVSEIDSEQLKNIVRTIKNYIIQYTIKPINKFSSFFLSAERIGISVFSKELFLNRFSSTNEILSLDEFNRTKVVELLNKNFNRYSLVIQDSLRIQEGLSRFKNRPNHKFALLADELENRLLNGNLSIDANGDVYYKTIKNEQSLKIQATGSIIKSLASLVFYLRYQASENHLLIIDEPEINLHPNNQIVLTKFLVRLSRMGIQVIISTHSDYVIREINNSIMLGKKTELTESLMAKHNYLQEETIDKADVDAYFFHNSIADKVEVKDTGFEILTIDDTIARQNNAMNEIRWTLFDE